MVEPAALKLIINLFTQGDSRYFDSKIQNLVAKFIETGAIDIEKLSIQFDEDFVCEEFEKIDGPQQELKKIAVFALKKRGFEIVGFERWLAGGKADVLARKSGHIIAVECGPCRVEKTIDYLGKNDTDLWIVTDYIDEGPTLHIIRRGQSWESAIKEHEAKSLESIKKVRSPLDSL